MNLTLTQLIVWLIVGGLAGTLFFVAIWWLIRKFRSKKLD